MTTSPASLSDFLLARIAEDEARAMDAYYEGQVWAPEEEAVVSLDRDLEPVMLLDRKSDAWFAADWSPARVLAECEAKRRIVEIHELVNADQGDGVGCMHCDWDREWGLPKTGGCDTLRFLTLPYADHPDYREEWRVA